jgi:hypothetical protein
MSKRQHSAWQSGLALGVALATSGTGALAIESPTVQATAAARAATPLWSYQPVRPQVIPQVQARGWVRSPLDAFILAKLEAQHLAPAADADRATLIRRATLDVWGLIPSVAEVDAFVKDRSPHAYEDLIERLLAAPQYGERQARRWLDLARYADSTGFQGDQTRPNMWRYRDYVIAAFNQNKPYDRFIKEQLAGDELFAGDESALIATGFLANYPDNRNSRDLVQRKYQITTDITDTVGEVFLAQTVQCARCHDHKFDRISAREYFQLQAFFANVSEVNDVKAKAGPIEVQYQQAQSKWEAAVADVRARQRALVEPFLAQAIQYQKERYLTDSRESLFKPETQWTALDRWVNHRWSNVTENDDFSAYLREIAENRDNPHYDATQLLRWQEYRRLTEELRKFDELKPAKGSDSITAMTELGHADAPPTYLLFGGDHEKKLQEVQPGFPAAIANGATPDIVPTATSSGRRAALAKWIASPDNPLTARVYVNRVWDQYFGRGLVRTVSDFGKAGATPTHPELLDYLADRFVRSGWDIKQLHRSILLSSVYRQASTLQPAAGAADPEDIWLAAFPRRRLEAEQIRDSLLVAAGQLDPSVGGPSVFAPIPKDLNVGNLWPVSKDPQDQRRRSLYIFTRRSIAYPLLASFDMSSSQQVHSKREVTTTPVQALTLYNSDLVFQWSQALAGRVLREAGGDRNAQLDLLYRILLARKPDANERTLLIDFWNAHARTIAHQSVDGMLRIALPTGVPERTDVDSHYDPVGAAAFVDLVHAVANSNQFTYRF